MNPAEPLDRSHPLSPPLRSSPQTTAAAVAAVNEWLDRFTFSGIKLGLERMQQLLADLGHPEKQVPIVHVAGSNGKGSVCAYLSSVLTAAGYRVGRYTSPHLVSWCERITLNQQDIDPIALYQLLQEIAATLDATKPAPTQFELITAAAWLYFAQQAVDIAVIEVGLGGRLDATNVCDRPLVSVITSLSREHWKILGDSIAAISAEKAGILKPGCPAVIAPQPPEAVAVLRQRTTELGCPTVWVTPAIDRGLGWAEIPAADGTDGVFSPSLRYPLPLPGLHQLTNSAVAIATLRVLQQQGWAIQESQICQGMAETRWPGRLQWLTWRDRPLLIDGAHNPAGATMLRHYVDHSDRGGAPVHWVMGMMATKDHGDVFQALLRSGDFLYLVPVPDEASADVQMLAALAQTCCPDLAQCQSFPDLTAGLEAAIAKPQGPIVLCGSLYLIGHFFQQLL